MRRLLAAAAVVLPTLALAQAPKEDPVGLVLLPGAGKLVRANTQTAIAAKAGDKPYHAGDVETHCDGQTRADGLRAEGTPTAIRPGRGPSHGKRIATARGSGPAGARPRELAHPPRAELLPTERPRSSGPRSGGGGGDVAAARGHPRTRSASPPRHLVERAAAPPGTYDERRRS